jgi:hypothetical protein
MGAANVMAVLLVIAGVAPQARPYTNAQARPEAKAMVDGGIKGQPLIEDAASGRRWCVARDARHPEWPARLVEISKAAACPRQSSGNLGTREGSGWGRTGQAATVQKGDLLLVSQDNKVVHAEIDAIALSSGRVGDLINVRLRFGGKVMRVRITSTVRAILIGDTREVRR